MMLILRGGVDGTKGGNGGPAPAMAWHACGSDGLAHRHPLASREQGRDRVNCCCGCCCWCCCFEAGGRAHGCQPPLPPFEGGSAATLPVHHDDGWTASASPVSMIAPGGAGDENGGEGRWRGQTAARPEPGTDSLERPASSGGQGDVNTMTVPPPSPRQGGEEGREGGRANALAVQRRRRHRRRSVVEGRRRRGRGRVMVLPQRRQARRRRLGIGLWGWRVGR